MNDFIFLAVIRITQENGIIFAPLTTCHCTVKVTTVHIQKQRTITAGTMSWNASIHEDQARGTGKSHQDQSCEPSLDLATQQSGKTDVRIVSKSMASIHENA